MSADLPTPNATFSRLSHLAVDPSTIVNTTDSVVAATSQPFSSPTKVRERGRASSSHGGG